ncbi:MAG: PDZ domain-containing protein [Crocinitomicaceae bacterium]|nr:PDZ domain-containing protein [Crocinitomicaceae bacterium]
MQKLLLFIAFAITVMSRSLAMQVDYQLSMTKPNSHYFEVEMTITDFKDKYVDVKMPVWAPGSYLVREFSKSIGIVEAENGSGEALDVKKITKNTWRIETKGIKTLKVKYEVYAFELSVRTSFLDDSHGYVNGTSMFMYVSGNKDATGTLKVIPHESFSKIATALPSKGNNEFGYEDYDQLVDCPIEIGNHTTFTFDAAGVKHTVAMYGESNADVEMLKRDMAKIVEAETKIFGENPNDEYLFIVHNITIPSGGLEHKTSTTLQVNRWTYTGDDYLGFLSLVAHEYFHLWNVKRIRPKALGPFNYDEENYTDLLWVMEGFTSYYDELALRRAGFYSEDDYINVLLGTMNYVENSPGNRVQPTAHASFDAWIKAYRPNENSVNTTMSYYSKGAICAAMLDLYIIGKYKGEKGLDHFMQMLWKDYYLAKDVGFTEEEFQTSLEKFLGENMDWFFSKYVYGTELVNYEKFFNNVGLKVTDLANKPTPYLGIRTSQSGGKLMIDNVYRNSAAETGGLSTNDEIIAINGYRMSQRDYNEFIGTLAIGDSFEIMVSRDNIIKNYTITMGSRDRFKFTVEPALDPETQKNFNYWLRVDV